MITMVVPQEVAGDILSALDLAVQASPEYQEYHNAVDTYVGLASQRRKLESEMKELQSKLLKMSDAVDDAKKIHEQAEERFHASRAYKSRQSAVEAYQSAIS